MVQTVDFLYFSGFLSLLVNAIWFYIAIILKNKEFHFFNMDEYYGLKYKSSPENFSYVLHKSGKKLDIIGSSLSPKKMGIELNNAGKISVPKFFLPPVQINKYSAIEIISKNNLSKIEKLVEKL
jgi:hypothetical protein